MPLIILIDSRESKLKKYFLGGNRTNSNAPISFQSLDIVDVQLRSQETDEIVYIIERKSISDFYSSINDGRYREQKARILASVPQKTRIAYIVEGNILDTSLNLNELLPNLTMAEHRKKTNIETAEWINKTKQYGEIVNSEFQKQCDALLLKIQYSIH